MFRIINFVQHSYVFLICLLSIILLSCDNLNTTGIGGIEGSESIGVEGPATDSGGGTYYSTDDIYDISTSLEYILKDHFTPNRLSLFHKHLKTKLKVSHRASNISDDDYGNFSLLLEALETPPSDEIVNSCIESKMNRLSKVLIRNDISSSSQKRYILPRHFILEALDLHYESYDYSVDLVDLEKTVKKQCSQSLPFAIYEYTDLLSSSFSELNSALHTVFVNNRNCKDLSKHKSHRDMVVSTFKHGAFVCISSETTEEFKSLDSSEKERALISLLYHEYAHMKGFKKEVLPQKFQVFVFSHLASFNELKFLLPDLKLLKEYFKDIKHSYDSDSFANSSIDNDKELLTMHLNFPFITSDEIAVLESFYDGVSYFIEKRNRKIPSIISKLMPEITRSLALVENRLSALKEISEGSVLNANNSHSRVNYLNKSYIEIQSISKEMDEQISLILRGYNE